MAEVSNQFSNSCRIWTVKFIRPIKYRIRKFDLKRDSSRATGIKKQTLPDRRGEERTIYPNTTCRELLLDVKNSRLFQSKRVETNHVRETHLFVKPHPWFSDQRNISFSCNKCVNNINTSIFSLSLLNVYTLFLSSLNKWNIGLGKKFLRILMQKWNKFLSSSFEPLALGMTCHARRENLLSQNCNIVFPQFWVCVNVTQNK